MSDGVACEGEVGEKIGTKLSERAVLSWILCVKRPPHRAEPVMDAMREGGREVGGKTRHSVGQVAHVHAPLRSSLLVPLLKGAWSRLLGSDRREPTKPVGGLGAGNVEHTRFILSPRTLIADGAPALENHLDMSVTDLAQ